MPVLQIRNNISLQVSRCIFQSILANEVLKFWENPSLQAQGAGPFDWALSLRGSVAKDPVEPLRMGLMGWKDPVEPLSLDLMGWKDPVEPLSPVLMGLKDPVEPLSPGLKWVERTQ